MVAQNDSSPARFELRITSDPVELAPVRKRVETACQTAGLDEKATGEVGLCVNEALANVMRHAYVGRTDRPIIVSFDARDSDIVVTIRDWGSGDSPHWPPKQHNPTRPGGLGLICLHHMMDEVRFCPQVDGMLLEMIKHKQGKPTHHA